LDACYSADGYPSVASGIGRRTVFATHGQQDGLAVKVVFEEILNYMNGTSYATERDKRVAATAYWLCTPVSKQLVKLATGDGSENYIFRGLEFSDKSLLTAVELENLDLNYKLVMVDACCSAQTVPLNSVEMIHPLEMLKGDGAKNARETDELLQQCKDFADSFGPDCAYMGWSWEMGPNAAQIWSSEFVNNLKFDAIKRRGLTVLEAHQKFLNDNYYESQKPARAARNMKIYGSTGNIVETRKAVQ